MFWPKLITFINYVKRIKQVIMAKFDFKTWLKNIWKNIAWQDVAKNVILLFSKFSFLFLNEKKIKLFFIWK